MVPSTDCLSSVDPLDSSGELETFLDSFSKTLSLTLLLVRSLFLHNSSHHLDQKRLKQPARFHFFVISHTSSPRTLELQPLSSISAPRSFSSPDETFCEPYTNAPYSSISSFTVTLRTTSSSSLSTLIVSLSRNVNKLLSLSLSLFPKTLYLR